ncbi:hypothetical protein OZN62_13220 [Aurantiacibacter sp. MUD11]|uniref:hypothetical protein n=1 Tax=Aurantiacibacter sp. MUD11 TaxID=3003265 RepID=UPI0022AA09BC|nr:hypothetical protein [Aurantiacibacter sp. MUD11]WAT17857.1 hypothetical protein OZN62_13220 [Aurantiacibacter sp. MUD11]
MNHTFSGASKRHFTRPGIGQGNRGQIDSKSDLPGILSTLELRRLVAAMVD